jgi:hypothetical protein
VLRRRNLPDDVRAAIGVSVLERRTALAKSQRGKQGGKAGGRHHPKVSLEDVAVSELKPKERSRASVSKAARISERKLRTAREFKEKLPGLFARVRAGMQCWRKRSKPRSSACEPSARRGEADGDAKAWRAPNGLRAAEKSGITGCESTFRILA